MSTTRAVGIGSVLTTVALVLGAAGPAPADVNGIKVREAYEPVAFRLCTGDGPGGIAKCIARGDPPTHQVPAGRRLIIEQVSGECGSDQVTPVTQQVADIVAQTAGAVVPHSIVLLTFPNQPGGVVSLTNTRIYADAGSQVTIGLGAVGGDSFCHLAFSGQLVKP